MAERHQAYDNGVLRITQTAAPSGLAITGEIDEATYPALVTSLHELAEGHEAVQLDLSGVSYCDLAGLRAIVRLADDDGAGPGRRVLLRNVPQYSSTSARSSPSPAGTRSRDWTWSRSRAVFWACRARFWACRARQSGQPGPGAERRRRS